MGIRGLTIFITPFSRFKYLHAPHGVSSQNTMIAAWLRAFPAFSKFHWIVDGILSVMLLNTPHARTFLQKYADKPIALNLDKYNFFQNQVIFAGFQLYGSGYQVDKSITDAISNFPTPTNCTDLGSSLDWPTTCLLPLTPLQPFLSPKNDFYGHQLMS